MTALKELEISTRLMNVLVTEQINSLEQLSELTEQECMRWPNFGKASLEELKFTMAEHGLALNTITRLDRVIFGRDEKIARKLSIAIQALRDIQLMIHGKESQD